MLSPKRLGIAGGILGGASIFIMTLGNLWFGYAPAYLALIADLYPRYEISYVGSLIGLFYGFIDGFVALFILAWLYNRISD